VNSVRTSATCSSRTLADASWRTIARAPRAIVYLAGAGFVTGTVLECAGGANLTVGAMAGCE
jgi:hypothetical protein